MNRGGMEGEEWRPVVGFPAYQVSNRGRVRSSHTWRGQRDRILIGGTTIKGYPYVQIIAPGGGAKARAIHVLVAQAFIGTRPADMEVRHLDGNAKNCLVSNLAYGTHRENELDKRRHGTHPHGSKKKCVHGHPFNEENTRLRPDGGRRCAICRREACRRQRVRKALRAAGVAA